MCALGTGICCGVASKNGMRQVLTCSEMHPNFIARKGHCHSCASDLHNGAISQNEQHDLVEVVRGGQDDPEVRFCRLQHVKRWHVTHLSFTLSLFAFCFALI